LDYRELQKEIRPRRRHFHVLALGCFSFPGQSSRSEASQQPQKILLQFRRYNSTSIPLRLIVAFFPSHEVLRLRSHISSEFHNKRKPVAGRVKISPVADHDFFIRSGMFERYVVNALMIADHPSESSSLSAAFFN